MRLDCETKDFNPGIAGLQAIPYGACAALEFDQKWKDLESMNLADMKLKDWIKVSAVWEKDEANVCKNADVKSLITSLAELK